MLEVDLLGTGGMVPLPGRYLTSLMVRYTGLSVLIDCGEGTQIAIREAGLGFKRIGVICLTHFHADHTAGLPGLLLTMGNSGKTDPLIVIGPRYVREVTECLRVVARELPFEIEYRELSGECETIYRESGLSIAAHPVEHRIPCYAYRLDAERRPRFDVEKARALDIPVRYWAVLQGGGTAEHDGKIFYPEDVLGESRRGIRLCYSTDLRPGEELAGFAHGSDLWICEGMYGDGEMLEKAIERRHCLFSEAAEMAARAEAAELWLTHFSPSMPKPELFLQEAARIFPNVRVDGRHTELCFPGD